MSKDTSSKGSYAEARITAELLKRGYAVSIPLSHETRYDLILDREGHLEKVQCKYTESDGKVIQVRCKSGNGRDLKYKRDEIHWLAVFDATTELCLFIPSTELGEEGRRAIFLRLEPPANNQNDGINWAYRYVEPRIEGEGQRCAGETPQPTFSEKVSAAKQSLIDAGVPHALFKEKLLRRSPVRHSRT